jgi:hypothetical protein
LPIWNQLKGELLAQKSDGQSGSALSSAATNNGGPASGPHPDQKAVGPLSSDIMGLKGSLHRKTPNKPLATAKGEIGSKSGHNQKLCPSNKTILASHKPGKTKRLD